jgi:hypothetical protein
MNTQSISFQTADRSRHSLANPGWPVWARSLPCQLLIALVSAIPPVALVLLTTAAINAPTLLPAVQAAAGLTGFVFLALAIDSERLQAVLQTITAAALFGLAWASVSVSPELVIVAAMLVATWSGVKMFSLVRRICL